MRGEGRTHKVESFNSSLREIKNHGPLTCDAAAFKLFKAEPDVTKRLPKSLYRETGSIGLLWFSAGPPPQRGVPQTRCSGTPCTASGMLRASKFQAKKEQRSRRQDPRAPLLGHWCHL